MFFKTVLSASLFLICTLSAAASEEFLLAYYVEIEKDGGKFVLQQHGQTLNKQQGVSTPTGRGGRGKFSLKLASIRQTTGVLRLEYYDDLPTETDPIYVKDIEFSTEGARGELIDSADELSVELSYSIVVK